MAIADLTLQAILTGVQEGEVKADISALKNQAQGAVMQLKAVVANLDKSTATKAAAQLKAAIIAELRTTFAE